MKTFQTFDISAEYDAIHRTFPCHKDAPVIGLTGNFQEGACTLLEGYFTSILKAGGIPFIIPPVDETNSLINSLNALDGLLLTGGADINPLFLGEEPIKELHSINPRRDRQELLLAKLAADRQIPILGICRGIQVIFLTISVPGRTRRRPGPRRPGPAGSGGFPKNGPHQRPRSGGPECGIRSDTVRLRYRLSERRPKSDTRRRTGRTKAYRTRT